MNVAAFGTKVNLRSLHQMSFSRNLNRVTGRIAPAQILAYPESTAEGRLSPNLRHPCQRRPPTPLPINHTSKIVAPTELPSPLPPGDVLCNKTGPK